MKSKTHEIMHRAPAKWNSSRKPFHSFGDEREIIFLIENAAKR